MKVTLLKLTRKKEVVKRLEPQALADMIRNNPEERKVFNLRLHYQFMKPIRMDDGQVTIDSPSSTSIAKNHAYIITTGWW